VFSERVQSSFALTPPRHEARGNSRDWPHPTGPTIRRFLPFRNYDKSEAMNPRHAAALALVGWYLMVPPVTSDGRTQKDAPLSRWYIASNFETKEECEQVRQASSGSAICVASDDPRLKER
jgi:hypothetical protein